jgi:hypothetical protein
MMARRGVNTRILGKIFLKDEKALGMEDRKMTSKSKLWSHIFILISGAILLFPFSAYAQTPIDCGQTLAGSISAAAEKDSYTFTASANDGVTIRARKTSGNLTPYLELYNLAKSYHKCSK